MSRNYSRGSCVDRLRFALPRLVYLHFATYISHHYNSSSNRRIVESIESIESIQSIESIEPIESIESTESNLSVEGCKSNGEGQRTKDSLDWRLLKGEGRRLKVEDLEWINLKPRLILVKRQCEVSTCKIIVNNLYIGFTPSSFMKLQYDDLFNSLCTKYEWIGT